MIYAVPQISMSRDQVFVQSKQQKHKENVLDQLKVRSRHDVNDAMCLILTLDIHSALFWYFYLEIRLGNRVLGFFEQAN